MPRFISGFVVLLLILTSARAEEISEKGKMLNRALDNMGVDKLWLKGGLVTWDTGKQYKLAADGKPHTHCSAFVAAASMRLGVYILRPKDRDQKNNPDAKGHSETQLANAQFDWLESPDARKEGWHALKGAVEAQRKANQGHLVVASFKESGPRAGHIAIVRPGIRSDAEVSKDGPDIIQAGMTNYSRATLRQGFSNHRDAWETVHGVRFYYNSRELKLPE